MNLLLAGSFDDAERARWHEVLAAALPQHRLLLSVDGVSRADIEVAIVANPPAGALRELPGLRLIQSLWAGVDRLLGDPTIPPEVPIARMVDPALAVAMAETALWAVLSLHRGFFVYQQRQRQALWQQHAQRRADEVGITLLGFGAMGQACAQALLCGGYAVTAWTRGAGAPVSAVPGVQRINGHEALWRRLADSDIVINLLPLTADTSGLLDATFFGAMPRHGAIVNLGRGGHVVEADLLQRLDQGLLRHAVLDVFPIEPLPREHPYWRHERITVLPHAAALTDPRSAAQVVAANVLALAEGRIPAHLINRARGY